MPGQVVVMNHISWLDVFVLNSVLPSRFVAKADVQQWPLIGFLCQQAGTLFLDRQRRRAITSINDAMVKAMAQGEIVAIFPEGTTTRGNQLKPFKPALFQAAIDARTAVVPIVLHYRNQHGGFSDAPAYIGDMSLVQSIFAILSQRQLVAEMTVLPAIKSHSTHRTNLAEKTARAMCIALNKK
jgi:1-acyl-sn-glycerol-3-phosphate acyltransferase